MKEITKKRIETFRKRLAKELGSEDHALTVMFGLSVAWVFRKDYPQLITKIQSKLKSKACLKDFQEIIIAPYERKKAKGLLGRQGC